MKPKKASESVGAMKYKNNVDAQTKNLFEANSFIGLPSLENFRDIPHVSQLLAQPLCFQSIGLASQITNLAFCF